MNRRPESHNGPLLPRLTQNHGSPLESNTFLTANLTHSLESVIVFYKLWLTTEPELPALKPTGPNGASPVLEGEAVPQLSPTVKQKAAPGARFSHFQEKLKFSTLIRNIFCFKCWKQI